MCVFVSKSNNQYGHFVLKSEMKTENNAADAALKSAITPKKEAERNEGTENLSLCCDYVISSKNLFGDRNTQEFVSD